IVTDKKKKDFPDSLFEIKEYFSDYQILKDRYPELSSIQESAGTKEQWSTLQKKIKMWEAGTNI
ncbi:MAG: hypothetical protein LIP01_07430, partial [Tannerellaceae bacterium]|nr:hypothetical protein [Tannerellaceae bacterium]